MKLLANIMVGVVALLHVGLLALVLVLLSSPKAQAH